MEAKTSKFNTFAACFIQRRTHNGTEYRNKMYTLIDAIEKEKKRRNEKHKKYFDIYNKQNLQSNHRAYIFELQND
jgi:hypothetical protein